MLAKIKMIAMLAAFCIATMSFPTHAAPITEEWDSVKAPAAPALKPVTVDPKTKSDMIKF